MVGTLYALVPSCGCRGYRRSWVGVPTSTSGRPGGQLPGDAEVCGEGEGGLYSLVLLATSVMRLQGSICWSHVVVLS